MSRLGWVLVSLGCVLLVVLWYFLIFQPTSEDIEAVRMETESTLAQAQQQRARAAELRAVREAAPEAEAQLAAGQTVIPENASIPALFRQLQSAADDAGVRLTTITPSAPSAETRGDQEIATISVSMSVTGSYFQIVDLARRVEDPTLMPRALQWSSASLSPSDFPELSVSLGGTVFARGVEQLPTFDEPDEPVTDEEDEDEEADDPDADLEPEVEP